MRLCFSGFNSHIDLNVGMVSTLEIHNRVLFRRVCESLLSEQGMYAPEPYSWWSDEAELKSHGQLLFVSDPLNLPWSDKSLAAGLIKAMEELVSEDEMVRLNMEQLAHSVNSAVFNIALQLRSDYSFAVDWDLEKYLKCFRFGVELEPSDSLFDKLMKFLLLVEDVGSKKAVAFVNLKQFLGKNETEELMEWVKASGLSLFLLETVPDATHYGSELKFVIDQDLLEEWPRE